jgi:hypothetical protein
MPPATATVTATATPEPTFTPTATITPTTTPTAIGGQVRAYNDRYIYLDDGHENPVGVRLPTNKLTLRGYANFPMWSPDYRWIASLQSSSQNGKNALPYEESDFTLVTQMVAKPTS